MTSCRPPLSQPRSRAGEPTFLAATFADVLALRGYDHIDRLQPLVLAWQQLVDLTRPALIVSDYAPSLCLAAHETLPIVHVGSWFEMPAFEGPWFPALVKDRAPVVSQEHVLEVIQRLRERQGRARLKDLTSLLAGDRFVTLFPELDPYQAFRRESVWDPLEPLPAPAPLPRENRFFAYLTADCAQAEPILTALALTGCPGTVYLRNLGHELAARLRLQGLTVLEVPAPLATVLVDTSVLIHHGGVGTTQTALAMGRPQLVFPQHLEQTVNGLHLQKMGVGLSLAPDSSAAVITQSFRKLLTDASVAERTSKWARTFEERPRRPALPAIVDCCLARLREREAAKKS